MKILISCIVGFWLGQFIPVMFTDITMNYVGLINLSLGAICYYVIAKHIWEKDL